MINFCAGPSTSSHLTEALKNKKDNKEDVERERGEKNESMLLLLLLSWHKDYCLLIEFGVHKTK